MLLKKIATLDEVLEAHATVLSRDFVAYQNHTYRVANFCLAQIAQVAGEADGEQLERVAIAAAFHDLGIWTDRTFDYLPPSVRLATAYLARIGKPEWESEITEMIEAHHKLSPYRGDRASRSLVEPFRRADWIDVSRGLRTFGLPRALLRDVFTTWPNAGFHKKLAELELTRLRTHPWNPLPMVKF
jgi:hypothetical protein